MKPLSRLFYAPSARQVAPALLGCWLVRNTPDGPCGGPIVETEAYLVGDPACHAYLGETARNRVMWGPPGFVYVYLIYGNHFCLNAVCQPSGSAEAVLIRAIEPVIGLDWMRQHRPARAVHELTSGPGKLAAALDVDRKLDGADLCDPGSPLFIGEPLDRPAYLARTGPTVITRRIGLTKAADMPLRFCLSGSVFISRKIKPAEV